MIYNKLENSCENLRPYIRVAGKWKRGGNSVIEGVIVLSEELGTYEKCFFHSSQQSHTQIKI